MPWKLFTAMWNSAALRSKADATRAEIEQRRIEADAANVWGKRKRRYGRKS
ncbi:MAG: hypothetical protein PHF37_10630 [Phycisphaerae bacterium]|nr:hypothetical protein [Phycisphaerae bacterium]